MVFVGLKVLEVHPSVLEVHPSVFEVHRVHPSYNRQIMNIYYGYLTIGFLNKALLNPYFWGGYVRGGVG